MANKITIENNADISHCFDEYLVQGEGSQKERAAHWQIAIGLQDAIRLRNLPYLQSVNAEFQGIYLK